MRNNSNNLNLNVLHGELRFEVAGGRQGLVEGAEELPLAMIPVRGVVPPLWLVIHESEGQVIVTMITPVSQELGGRIQ